MTHGTNGKAIRKRTAVSSRVAGLHHDLFTIGEVARFCRVAPRTAALWFDSGRIAGYRIPGSQDRRVTREALLTFMRAAGLPLPPVFERQLVAGVEARLRRVFPESTLFFSTLIDLAFAIDLTAGWHTVVLDAWVFGRGQTFEAGAAIRMRLPQAVLIGIACEDDSLSCEWMAAGFNHVLACPFDGRKLAELLEGKP